jgi:hypothetical protein
MRDKEGLWLGLNVTPPFSVNIDITLLINSVRCNNVSYVAPPSEDIDLK